MLSSPQKETLCLLEVISHPVSPSPPALPSPGQPLLLPSLCICPFWTFCVNRILQRVVFCDQLLLFIVMFSGVIRVVAEARIPFLFHGWVLFHCTHHHIVFTHSRDGGHLWCCHGWAVISVVMDVHLQVFCVWTYVFVSLASYLGLRSLVCGVALPVTYWESARLFPK